MLSLLLAAQLAADSIYPTAALRELVARIAERNRSVPRELQSYRARLESEISFVARRPDAIEAVVSIEQVQNATRWLRTGEYEQHVTGYRSQSTGFTFASIGFFRQAWSVPVLYGNRLSLFFGLDTTQRTRRERARQRVTTAVHPFAERRDRYYRYTGGDTAVTIRVLDRTIPVARIMVEPQAANVDSQTVLFRGEVDVDATRGEIVRMRGYFVTLGRGDRSLGERLLQRTFRAVAFVELVNAEVEGRFWLPSYQRFEAQASFQGFDDTRSVFRIVSRFRDHRVNDIPVIVAEADTLALKPHALTFAPKDSLERATSWSSPLGHATAQVHSDDFMDVAPDAWRPTGRARFELRAPQLGDFVHFNRVEGLFTGVSTELRLRDDAPRSMPGLIIRAAGGWAWSEEAARGRIDARWRARRWAPFIRAGRSLDITNDFRRSFDSVSSLGALLWSIDDFDYVDRRSAMAGATRFFGGARTASLRVEAGVGRDAGVVQRLDHGLTRPDSGFRVNRGVDAGSYTRTTAVLQYHPDVNAEFVRPGVGATLSYDRGDGELDWQRLEARLVARTNVASMTYALRVDGGILWSDDPPPQHLFELGWNQGLPGYRYKEFAGDRAALARTLAVYNLGVLRAPVHVWRRFYLPSPAPGLFASLHAGWADASDVAALRSIARLGYTRPDSDTPISNPTNGIRSGVELGLRLFGGGVSVSVGRPLDRRGAWKLGVSFSEGL
jgi:hypothetical protein